MTRRAIATLVFCAAVLTTLAVVTLHPFDTDQRTRVAAVEGASSSCAPADDDGAWTDHHRVAAAVTEWVAKCRTLHAHARSGIAIPCPAACVAEASASPARTPRAPSHLLHTPLLI